VELLRGLSWYWFGVCITNIDVIDDCINESALGELNAPIALLSDHYSNIVRWVSSIFNVKACSRNLANCII
jgi:hypothetical protein